MKFSLIPAQIPHRQLVVLPAIVIIAHLVIASAYNPGKPPPRRHGVPGSTSSSSPEALAMEDFNHLTDKLTHKIMMDIEKLKKEDPNFGNPEHMPGAEGELTEKQMKELSECEFQCPDGQVPEDNPSFEMPTIKNCKPYDSTWDRIPGASGCCVRHQICYHTCARDRTQCDMEFRMCIENVCVELQEEGVIRSEKVIESCQSSMGMLGIMIMEPGCKMYPKAQSAACRCVENVTDVDDGPDDFNLFDKDISKVTDKDTDKDIEKKPLPGKKGDIFDSDEGNEAVGDVENTIANDEDGDQVVGWNDGRDEL